MDQGPQEALAIHLMVRVAAALPEPPDGMDYVAKAHLDLDSDGGLLVAGRVDFELIPIDDMPTQCWADPGLVD